MKEKFYWKTICMLYYCMHKLFKCYLISCKRHLLSFPLIFILRNWKYIFYYRCKCTNCMGKKNSLIKKLCFFYPCWFHSRYHLVSLFLPVFCADHPSSGQLMAGGLWKGTKKVKSFDLVVAGEINFDLRSYTDENFYL